MTAATLSGGFSDVPLSGAGTAALEELRQVQKADFIEILEAMDGLPVTVRLLDPPLHEFLPHVSELEVKQATKGLSAEDAKKKDGEFKKGVADALKAAGYPAKADPAKMNKPMIIGILVILVILVTMVYGPIAAMLVELFPTRIRYTSMSLPYHIGNGWFGGLLPTTAFAIVAQTGNMYNGLWYPIIIAAVTFVVGMLFVRETKDVDIYAKD